MQADPADLPLTRLRPGIRVKPLGRAFAGFARAGTKPDAGA